MITFAKNEEQNIWRVYYVKPRDYLWIGDLYMECDGFWKFLPEQPTKGYWDEDTLLTVGGKLKELNATWKEQIERDLKDD